MSGADPSAGQQKYYDPAEVEAYIRDATTTITTLQTRLEELTRRAAAAEEALGDYQPETASLGRALLLAGEVADKSIADADAKASEIVRAAGARANQIVDAAQVEANRLTEAAWRDASDAFEAGRTRLLAAVNAFVEGSNVLRAELAGVENDAKSRSSTNSLNIGPRPPTGFAAAPAAAPSAPRSDADLHFSHSDALNRFLSGGYNGVSREKQTSPGLDNDRTDSAVSDPPDITVTSFSPPKPRTSGLEDRHDGVA